jgi:hypothetical protein
MWWLIMSIWLDWEMPRKLVKCTSKCVCGGCFQRRLACGSADSGGDTHPECGWHCPLDWGLDWTKSGIRESLCVHAPNSLIGYIFCCCHRPCTTDSRFFSLLMWAWVSDSIGYFQAFSLRLGGIHHWALSFWDFQLLRLNSYWFPWLFSLQMAIVGLFSLYHINKSINVLIIINTFYWFYSSGEL